jgi:hypothetical protein
MAGQNLPLEVFTRPVAGQNLGPHKGPSFYGFAVKGCHGMTSIYDLSKKVAME